jgi:hypothetical protein
VRAVAGYLLIDEKLTEDKKTKKILNVPEIIKEEEITG